jgi:hypothetical protein
MQRKAICVTGLYAREDRSPGISNSGLHLSLNFPTSGVPCDPNRYSLQKVPPEFVLHHPSVCRTPTLDAVHGTIEEA